MSGDGGFGPTRRQIGAWVVATLAAAAVIDAVYRLMSAQGVGLFGDSPSYIILAQALTHGTVEVRGTILRDLARHTLAGSFPPGTTYAGVEHFVGPRGVVAPFDPGLPALIAPFVAVLGPVRGAEIGVFSLNSAGLVWLHQRASHLWRLRGGAQAVLALAFALPAVAVSATAVYPDLPAGLLLGMAAVELAAAELARRIGVTSAVVTGATLAVAVWLQPKNLVPVAVLSAAFVAVWIRARGPGRRVATLAGPVAVIAVSAAGMLAYNRVFYGHWLGIPEPTPRLSREAQQLTLGLLFDRDQGLFVQVPWAGAGLVGLVVWGIRRMPATVVATLGAFVGVLALNGTYTSNPYGGGSLAGRFMWTLVPLCLPWLGLVLSRAGAEGRSMWPAAVLAGAAIVWQGAPIVQDDHPWFNPLAVAYRTWPSWWAGLAHLLPQFGRTTRVLGVPGRALPVELAGLVGLGFLTLWWGRADRALRRDSRRRWGTR